MKKHRQLSLLPAAPTQFGGSLLSGKRKSARPLDSAKPLHLVLKSKKSIQIVRHKNLLQKILQQQASQFAIKVYSQSIQRERPQREKTPWGT